MLTMDNLDWIVYFYFLFILTKNKHSVAALVNEYSANQVGIGAHSVRNFLFASQLFRYRIFVYFVPSR